MPSNPAWWKEAKALEYVFRGAWDKVSKEFFTELRSAFKDQDIQKAKDLLKNNDLGSRMVKAVGKKPQAILVAVQQKAHRYWGSQIKAIPTKAAIDDFSGDYQKYIADRISEQVNDFLAAHPDRILTPEIQRQLDYLAQSDLTTSVDVADILDRLERVTPQQQYWTNLSTVQTSRIWHADAMQLAKANGIRRGVFSGPEDDLVCPVCQRMIGVEFDVETIVGQIDESLDLTDIDDYVSAWPFPRINDVSNISRKDLAAKGFFTPFHPNCRHSCTLLSR